MSENASIKGYVRKYMMENLKLALIIDIPFSLLFLVCALIADVLDYDLVLSLVPLLLGFLVLCICYLKTLRFKRMISQQEIALNVSFSDSFLTPIYKRTLFYCSDEWFLRAGCWAFHRDYIKKISVRVINEKSAARRSIVCFHTIDGREIAVNDMLSGEIKKLRQWLENQDALIKH